MSVCPCCGSEIQHKPNPAVLLDSLSLGYVTRASLRFLARRMGQWTTSEEIANEVYRGVRDGGPASGPKSVSVQLCAARPKLRGTGLVLEGRPNNGYRLSWDRAA